MKEDNNKQSVIVIGHKNPDTDSICSAIAYANLKNKISNNNYKYIPKRAGHINEETQYVLKRFNVEMPEYVTDVGVQVRDMDIRKVPEVAGNISVRKAWNLMKEQNVITLPVIKNNRLQGIITINDITSSDMDILDNSILAKSKTQYKNLIETLEGELIVGDENKYITDGKILIAAANPDIMEQYIEPKDIIILGNRYESQLCAIEMNAGCIIVCMGAPISLTIKKLAEEKGCFIISTNYDTYMVARLINQSAPIEYYMKKDKLITFKIDDLVEQIKDTMTKVRHRDFPILDNKGKYYGMISRRNLLGIKHKKVILVDHNELSQAVDGLLDAEILEIIDHHRIGSIETISPVFFRNQPLGCTATIIYQMYGESGIKIEPNIAGLLCSAIISDTLMFRSPTCTEIDKQCAIELSKIANINIEEFATEMFKAGSNLKDKSPEEIFYQDFKKFSTEGITFGVGQITSMNTDELSEIKTKLLPYMKKSLKEHNLDMLFFMLTDIINESTELLYIGNNVENILENTFNISPIPETLSIKGLVSRKKQLIPELMRAITM